MIANCFHTFEIPVDETLEFNSPVEGWGFAAVIVRAPMGTLTISLKENAEKSEAFSLSTSAISLRFDTYGNDTPETLYIRNSGTGAGKVCIFIERLGANPV